MDIETIADKYKKLTYEVYDYLLKPDFNMEDAIYVNVLCQELDILRMSLSRQKIIGKIVDIDALEIKKMALTSLLLYAGFAFVPLATAAFIIVKYPELMDMIGNVRKSYPNPVVAELNDTITIYNRAVDLYGLKILRLSKYPTENITDDEKLELSGDAIKAFDYIFNIMFHGSSSTELSDVQRQIATWALQNDLLVNSSDLDELISLAKEKYNPELIRKRTIPGVNFNK